MTPATAPEPRKPRKAGLRPVLLMVVAALLIALIAGLYPFLAAVLAAVWVAVTVLVARARWPRSSVASRLAARRRRRHQGPASWSELQRHTTQPDEGGIPICTVTRGRTR